MISEEDIPENWEIKPIKDVATINPRISISERDNYAYVPMSAVNPDIQQIDSYERKDNIYSGLSKFKDGDVIIAKITPCFENKNIAIVNNIPQGYDYAVGSSELVVFRPTEISKKYLFNYLRSKYVMDWGENRLIGSTGRERIKISQFRNELYIPVPPKEEQERIVSYIERELNWVEELEKSTSLLREYFTEYKKSLLNTVFTGSKNITKQTHKITKNDIPENWKMGNIGENVDFQSGKAFKSNDYIDKSDSSILCFRVSNYTPEGKLKLDDCSYLPKKFINKYQSVLLHNNDVLITMVGASCGKMYYVDKEGLPALLNQNMWRLRCNKDTIIQRYLYYYLKSCQDYITNTTNGSARKYLTQKKIKDISIPLPSIEKQRNICKNLDNKFSYIDSHIDIIDNLEENLTEYKESVLSSAFKGNISN